MSTTEIVDYEIFYYSNRTDSHPRILLFDKPMTNPPLFPSPPFAALTFFPSSSTLPLDCVMPPGCRIRIYMNFYLEDFQNVLDLLRNEKPVYLTGGSNPTYTGPFYISTSPEPIGEGEK